MAHEITFNDLHMPNPYSQWIGGAIGKTGPSHSSAAAGCGGVLYPPGMFDKEYFNYDTIERNCLTADDLWLKYTEYRLNYRVYKVRKHAKNPVTISRSQGVALSDLNNGQHKNDVIVDTLNKLYAFKWE